MTTNKFKFLWEPWARLQTLTAESFLLIGGIIVIFYTESTITIPMLNLTFSPTFAARIFNLVVPSLVMALEMPLFTLPFIWTNYYFKFLFLTIQGVIGMMTAPTHTGALCIFCAAITYLVAAVKGESASTKNVKGKR